MTYTPIHDPLTGRFAGVLRSDGAQIPPDVANRDWREFLQWNATAAPPVSLADAPAPDLAARTRAEALATLNTRADLTAVQVRALIESIVFLINNRLEALGQPRLLAPEIFAYLAANPTAGDPAGGTQDTAPAGGTSTP